MNTLNSELRGLMVSATERASNFGECVQVEPDVMLALLSYIDDLEEVSMYADSVCSMLTEGGWPGKREALGARIAAAIESAKKVNKFYEK